MRTFYLLLFFFGFTLFSHGQQAVNDAYENALQSFHQQQYETTIIHLKNALQANEQHIPSHLLLAKTFLAQGKGALAQTELEDIQAMGVEFNQLITLYGQAFILQEQYNKALEIATPGFREKNIEKQILVIRGQAYLGLNQLRFADNAFRDALHLDPQLVDAQLGLAQVAMQQHNYDSALIYVEKALASYQPPINGYLIKAQILWHQGKPKKAIDILNQTLETQPNYILARFLRANLLISQQSFELAEQDVDFILSEIEKEPRARFLKALILAAKGDQEQSKKALNTVLVTLNAIPDEVMTRNPSYYYLAGLVNYQFGHLEDAQRQLKAYLTINEQDLNALHLFAQIAMQQKDWILAKSLLTKANVYFPNQVEIISMLGAVSLALDDPLTASRYFEQALSIETTTSTLVNVAEVQLTLGNYQQAIDHLIKAKQLAPNDDTIQVLLLKAYLKTNKHQAALEIAQQLLKKSPNNSYFLQQLAISQGFLGQYQAAEQTFKKVLTQQPDNLAVIAHLARMYSVSNRSEQAIQLIKQALTNHKNNTFLMTELANIYLLAKQPEQALVWLEKAQSNMVNNSDILVKLTDLYVQLNQLDKALTLVDNFLNTSPKNAEILTLKGKLLLVKNQPRAAVEQLQKAVDYANDKSQALMLLADAQLLLDERLLAIKSLNKAIALEPLRLAPKLKLFNLSLQYNDLKRAKQLLHSIRQQSKDQALIAMLTGDLNMANKAFLAANKAFTTAFNLAPNNHNGLGVFQSYLSAGKVQKAESFAHQWRKLQPKNLTAAMALAESLSAQNKLTEANKLYQSLIHEFPKTPVILNNAANVAINAKQYSQAVTWAEQAYQLAPNNPNVLDTLGWAYYHQQQYKQALARFREALVNDFNNPEIKYHLALTLNKLNRKTEAIQQLSEALQTERAFTHRKIAKQLLQQWRQG